MGVYDALVVVHAFGRLAILLKLRVLEGWKLTGVLVQVARLVYPVGRGQFVIAAAGWLSSRIAGQRCPRSILVGQLWSTWKSRILAC